MTAKKYLLDLGFDDSHLPELFNDHDKSYYSVSELMEDYHKANCKSLPIFLMKDQINIIKNLLEATEELNGEFQHGWSNVIDDGEVLVSYLEKNTIDSILICFMQYLSNHYNIDQVIDCTKHKEIINNFKSINQEN